MLRSVSKQCLHGLAVFWFQEGNADRVELGSDAEIRWICHLLQLSEDWLKQALTSKVTVSARGLLGVSHCALNNREFVECFQGC